MESVMNRASLRSLAHVRFLATFLRVCSSRVCSNCVCVHAKLFLRVIPLVTDCAAAAAVAVDDGDVDVGNPP